MMRVGGGGPALLNAVRWMLPRYTRGKILEIGLGEYKAFPHFIGMREKSEVGVTIKDPVKADFEVDSFEHVDGFIEGVLDGIFIWGLNERSIAIIAATEHLIKPGGYIINAWAGKNITDPETGLVVSNTPAEVAVGRIGEDGKMHRFEPPDWAKREKSCLVIRYGAIGDMLQCSMVLPELKRQGYHVTMNCHPVGYDILRNDPNVDEFFVQDQDQVPNQELGEYWKFLDTQYDRIVNLCESVEGALLLYPGRSNHRWSFEMRQKYCNTNYLEFTADIAGVPLGQHHFYPTDEEVVKTKAFLRKIGDYFNPGFVPGMARWVTPFVVGIPLAGSSIHKFYPHMDAVIAKILLEIPERTRLPAGRRVCADARERVAR